MNSIEQLIVASILQAPDFRSKVYPHIRPELFISSSAPLIVELIKKFNDEYKGFPSKDALLVELDNKAGLSEDLYTKAKTDIGDLFTQNMQKAIEKVDQVWLLDKAEKYLKTQSCHLAVMESLSILDGENKKLTPDAIPDILKDALSISFDTNVGHDYIDDADARFDFYHRIEQRIPFRLSALNAVTDGGIPRKAMLVPVAPTGVGKSLFMTDWASFLITKGLNVLYVTLELAEERVAERIDANLMDITMSDLKVCPKNVYDSKLNAIKRNPLGKLKIKEYAPGTFHANHLRFLLQEYKNKQGFVPDVIMVDYLNLMASYRMKDNSNSYQYIKAVAEELRGVAMETNTVAVSPTQTNRNGNGVSDFELNEVSESFGIAMTADMMFGMISTPELDELGHLRLKQLKNRFGDINKPSSFIVSINRAKMQLRDLDVIATPPARNQQQTKELNTSSKASKLKF